MEDNEFSIEKTEAIAEIIFGKKKDGRQRSILDAYGKLSDINNKNKKFTADLYSKKKYKKLFK